MRIVCSYCQKDMGEKEPLDDQRISHSICVDCQKYFEAQRSGMPLDEYLGSFDFPVMIINDDRRVVGINKAAEKLTGRTSEKSTGLLGGEAMECSYARLPGGCGQTIHCETCTIRKIVMGVMESGESKKHAPVTLRRDAGEVTMLISAEKIDGMVRLSIEKVLTGESA
jgi:ferredoxin